MVIVDVIVDIVGGGGSNVAVVVLGLGDVCLWLSLILETV